MKISVPGNLLLFGEYAVTYPGGLGIAVATRTQLSVDVSQESELIITGTHANQNYSWSKGRPFPTPLLKHLVTAIGLYPAIKIHLDSSQFYYPDGTKKGFGSSAAVTVGLLYALLQGRIGSMEKFAAHALQLHRSFQGGKGSGYDIYTSIMGGAGLFTGGEVPQWSPICPDLYQDIHLLRGARACRTHSALAELHSFEASEPKRLEKYLRTSNTLTQQLTHSLRSFHKASRINRWINRHLSQPIPWEDLEIKPLGAGGELGAAIGPVKQGQRLAISQRGVQCLL